MLRSVFLALAAACVPLAAHAEQDLQVRETRFDLLLPDGARLGSEDLVGAVLEIEGWEAGVVNARLEAVEPAAEDPSVLLHMFSVRDAATGQWRPLCQPDGAGRQAAFPVAGRWDAKGGYVKDSRSWFLTCTSGSQGKCVLWGYNPFRKGPNGADLAPFYQACQHMVRADYDGLGAAHTRDGTPIDTADVAGVQSHEMDPRGEWTFEAGWGPNGAVCVARTRWEDLLPTRTLLESQPQLAAAPCDEAEARRRGALLFNRSRVR
jgi:hypothetical protein